MALACLAVNALLGGLLASWWHGAISTRHAHYTCCVALALNIVAAIIVTRALVWLLLPAAVVWHTLETWFHDAVLVGIASPAQGNDDDVKC